MKRHPALAALSSDHHQALVLARRIERACAERKVDAALASEVAERYREELLPHFSIEERWLLPALEAVGEHVLVAHTLQDHRTFATLAQRLNDPESLCRFGTLLKAHVRFEERELFTVAQSRLEEAALAQIGVG